MLGDNAGWQLKLVALCTRCFVVTLPSLRSHCVCEEPCKTARCLIIRLNQNSKIFGWRSVASVLHVGWQCCLATQVGCIVHTMLCSYFAQLEKPLFLWRTMQNSKMLGWTSVASVLHVVWHCWLATQVGCIVHTMLCSYFAQLEKPLPMWTTMQNSKMFDHQIESKQQDVWLKKCCKRLTCWVTMLFGNSSWLHCAHDAL